MALEKIKLERIKIVDFSQEADCQSFDKHINSTGGQKLSKQYIEEGITYMAFDVECGDIVLYSKNGQLETIFESICSIEFENK